MQNSNIFSARNVTLFVFILVVLFLGATFDVKLGPESFSEYSNMNNVATSRPSMTTPRSVM
jgi:hypothetical protein